MTDAERERWDELYRTAEFDPSESPSPLLEAYVDQLPEGRALDVATGNGRNALFLAAQGYEVDAIDISGQALGRARERESEREQEGTESLAIEWIEADIDEYDFPPENYAVINASYYYDLDRLTDIKEALAPGGVLVYEHHLRSAEPVESGPSTDRFRFGANELLRACLDLTVLHYAERREKHEGRTGARVSLLARRSTGASQSYLREPTPTE